MNYVFNERVTIPFFDGNGGCGLDGLLVRSGARIVRQARVGQRNALHRRRHAQSQSRIACENTRE